MKDLEDEPGANAGADVDGVSDDGDGHATETTDTEEGLSVDASAADTEHLIDVDMREDKGGDGKNGHATETTDTGEGLSVGASSAADTEHLVDVRVGVDKDEDAKNDNDPQNPDGGDLLRGWAEPPPPTSPINYDDVDETPYEHKFEPGDHIIRWDMLPILWPIQIHGIVLEVSEDKSEVTICDFGVTSVKNDKDDKKLAGSEIESEMNEKKLEEENSKFNEAIQDEDQDVGLFFAESYERADSTDASVSKKESYFSKKKKQQQRLHVRTLTKWSDLRKWHKVDYEGGLLNIGRKGGAVGKGLKHLGKKTEDLWNSMAKSAKSFAKPDAAPKQEKEKVWRSVRYDVDVNGYCVHHPHIQLKRLKENGDWVVVRKKCPECIMEDCPAMLGEESPKSKAASVDSAPSFSSTEDEIKAPEEVQLEELSKPKDINSGEASTSSTDKKSLNSSGGQNDEHPRELTLSKVDDEVMNDDTDATNVNSQSDKNGDEPKTMAQMIAEANAIESQSRKTVVRSRSSSPQKKPVQGKRASWRGSFMKSMSNMSNILSQNKEEVFTNADSTSAETQGKSLPGENEEDAENSEKKPTSVEDLPRSDPPVLVLARTRFILEHGENILPPYHIINSNSECIAVWCKTGRWSTLQASVFLHSTAIGHAKSATALTIGVAATQPWLIPAFATVGLAAVGTPWLFLKVANDKWNEATMSLTEKFWMQAEPEVFVECIDKWRKIALE